MEAATEQDVRDWWQPRTCGTAEIDAEPFTQAYFDAIERRRYEVEPFIREFAGFDNVAGKRVLEIGVGACTDFINFARGGALLSGVDLTSSAIDHGRRRLELEDLDAQLQVASAEELPFNDNSFDLVYSWGVLHHAAHPEQTFSEVRRVLTPGGEARIMLYGRHSWVAYKRWMLGVLVDIKRRERLKGINGAISRYMESPGTRCYTRKEIVREFSAAGFTTVDVEGFLTTYDQRFIGPIARMIRQDWFLGVAAS